MRPHPGSLQLARDERSLRTSQSQVGRNMAEPVTRAEAQTRAEEIRAFALELARLETAQVVSLSDEQHRSIDAHHRSVIASLSNQFDIDRDTRAKQLSLGMRIASLLGALALAASVFFLFHQFWGRLSTGTQVAALLGASGLTYWVTHWIRSKDESGYFTKLAALVAFACFVLNISMMGDIFNITPSDKAFLPWAAYAFLLAYLCDLRLLLVAGLVCITAFIAARAGEFGGSYWLEFGERPENFIPAAIGMFGVPLLTDQSRYAGFAQTYRIVALLAVFLPMLVLANWGDGSYLPLEAGTIEHLYQALGFLATGAAIALGIRKHWSDVVNTSVTFFVVFLYTKFYDWWWEVMPKYLFFLVLGLTALLTLFVLRRLRTQVIS
jgi:uncharacterized membrane protein